ncbi:MAG: hypothetical protein AAGA70_01445 [Pseudomonadota bacterium]
MFTWIFRLLPIALLSGCIGLGLGGERNAVTVTQDAISVTGPRGFCIDNEALRDDGQSAFVLMGNCASIAGSRFVGQPRDPAVLTAAISAPGEAGGVTASLSELPEYFASPDGRTVLSRTGNPETVEVLQNFIAGEVLYLRARDTSPGVVPGVEDTYWRAYFDIGPRIATLSVLALQTGGTDEAAQLATLEAFVSATRAANPGGRAAEPAPQPGLFSSFRGLFGGRG